MSTLNGFGSIFYGWKHKEVGYSSATKWLAVFYIPVVPLGRYKLDVVTDFKNEKTHIRGTSIGLVVSQSNNFNVVEKTDLDWSELLVTYAKAFVGLPLLMFAPFLLLLILSSLNWLPHYQGPSNLPVGLKAFLMIFSLSALCNVFYWPIWAIRKSRGRQTKQGRSPTPQNTTSDRLRPPPIADTDAQG